MTASPRPRERGRCRDEPRREWVADAGLSAQALASEGTEVMETWSQGGAGC